MSATPIPSTLSELHQAMVTQRCEADATYSETIHTIHANIARYQQRLVSTWTDSYLLSSYCSHIDNQLVIKRDLKSNTLSKKDTVSLASRRYKQVITHDLKGISKKH